MVYSWHWCYPLELMAPQGWCSRGQLTNRLSISVPVRGPIWSLWPRLFQAVVLGHTASWSWRGNLVGACVWWGWSEAVLAQLNSCWGHQFPDIHLFLGRPAGPFPQGEGSGWDVWG